MNKYRITLFILTAFCVMGALYADGPFSTGEEAYRFGYEEGYQHGLADRAIGFDFDVAHSHSFQSGITYSSYDDGDFRRGYAEGYSGAYYARARSGELHGSSGFAGGFVTVFTRDGFKGEARQFPIGRYDDLDGKWDDSISSIQVNGPVRVVLFDEKEFRGRQFIVERDLSELDEFNFDSKAESMIVEPIRLGNFQRRIEQ